MAEKYSPVKNYIIKPLTAQKLDALCIIIGEIN
jgi:hypothetical protein